MLNHQGFGPAANQAADALSDLFGFPGPSLVAPVRVGDQLAGHPNHIGLTLRDDLLAVFGRTQGMAGDYRDVHRFFHGLGRIGIPSFGVVHRIHHRLGNVKDPRGNIQSGDPRFFQLHCNADGFLQLPAVIPPFFPGIPDENREIFATFYFDPVDDFQYEPHAVLKLTSEPIVPGVGSGAQELRDHIAVRSVQFHRVKPRFLHPPGCFGKLFNQIVYLFHRHFPGDLAM
ncbi:hypothetical protein SDC9_174866 [bioreactor metagenome]|uniref:Uncharacterized protein n=1 Tax=bioreactor metagenome TaxID=1076179 RepID=A0A645GUW5_9ZZZZ